MTRIAQMQVRFEPAEDRLLLRIRSTTGLELRLWLTRRYLRLAWPALTGALDASVTPAEGVEPSPLARREMTAFEHQEALQQSDFDTRFEDNAGAFPLGQAPVLLGRFALEGGRDAETTVCMHPLQGQGVEVAMDLTLLHAFCKLLADGARAAAWDLPIALPGAEPVKGERPH